MKQSLLSERNSGFCCAVVMTIAAVAGVSCRKQSDQPSDTARIAQSRGSQPAAGHYSLQDFARLRWLEGRWRGTLADGGHFYERYHFVDDSTIAMNGFGDSAYATPSDSATISLRGGIVADESPSARWVATHLDSSGVAFSSTKSAANSFAFARVSRDRWTATLLSTNAGGGERKIVYPMERFAGGR